MDPREQLEQNLDAFLREARKHPRLTGDEEASLLAAARAGDEPARRRVIESHLLEVAELALAMRVEAPLRLPPLDAIQEAILPLVRLVEDPAVPEMSARLPEALNQALRRFT